MEDKQGIRPKTTTAQPTATPAINAEHGKQRDERYDPNKVAIILSAPR
jgi:hypothetical protein